MNNQLLAFKKNRLIDLSGQRFNHWLVLRHIVRSQWECKCDCGNICQVKSDTIRVGRSTQCAECRKKSRLLEIGAVFGKWTVLEKVSSVRKQDPRNYYKCKCECGYISEVPTSRLIQGNSLCCVKCKGKKAYGASAFTTVFISYKLAARNRGLEWELTEEQFLSLTTSNCYYTGLPPSTISKTPGGVFVYNGIDRLDNSRGYVMDNCVPCNSIVNRMKMDMSYSYFIEICSLITMGSAEKVSQIVNSNKLKAV